MRVCRWVAVEAGVAVVSQVAEAEAAVGDGTTIAIADAEAAVEVEITSTSAESGAEANLATEAEDAKTGRMAEGRLIGREIGGKAI